MLFFPLPNTYAQFKATHGLLLQKHDSTVVYELQSLTEVRRVAAVFNNTQNVRLDFAPLLALSVADFLTDFPDAIAVSGISAGV